MRNTPHPAVAVPLGDGNELEELFKETTNSRIFVYV